MTERRKIILTEDDFDDRAAGPGPGVPHDRGPQEGPASSTLPPVDRRPPTKVTGGSVGTQKGALRPAFLYDERTSGLAAAALGMLLAWAITEVLGILDLEPESVAGLHAIFGLWTAVVTLVFCAVVVGFYPAIGGAWNEVGRRVLVVVIPALAVGFVAGYIASAIYWEIVESAFEQSDFVVGEHDVRLYVATALGWTVFGAAVGAVLGVVDRSRSHMVNGVLGGLAGGALGGLLFQFTAAVFSSDALSRLVALLGIGLLVAAATRAVEHARREAWLTVLGGGLRGKEFIVYHAITRIGSAPSCEIFLLRDPGVAPEHARIEDHGSARTLRSTAGSVVLVNQAPVTSHRLRDGDRLEIGNSTIEYSERGPARETHGKS